MQWLKTVFEPLTREKAAGRIRVLILDGHSSHYSLEFLQFCILHNIIVLVYPPHCTHALQGLDVVCFAKFKKEWHAAIAKFEDENQHAVGKEDFLSVFGGAFQKSFDPEMVKAAFRVTGVHPYDETVIAAEQMKPAELTSTISSFPMDLPSPVKRVVDVFHHHEITSFDTDMDTHLPARSEIETPPTSSTPSSAPTTPKRPRTDAYIDPDLYTPNKRMRIMVGSLAASTSGSFLVSKSRMTSAMSIAGPVIQAPPKVEDEPDWALINAAKRQVDSGALTKSELETSLSTLTSQFDQCRRHIEILRMINEGANAQLLIQDLYCSKLKGALHAKDGKKAKDNTHLLGDGLGKVMTTTEVMDKIAAQQAAKEAEAAAKAQRKVARESKKDTKEEIDRLWGEESARHAVAVDEWTKRCSVLRSEGVRIKDLPPKPTKRKKADIAQEVNAAAAARHEDEAAMNEAEGEEIDDEEDV